ncbi:actin-like ATPase domain-containing protein [Aspergillus heteromorphus CBS 117.55]|uniref:Actin-like ATPase domain-containing protein n=1 Tax=Aspergillus heteromorphus CBS 117.55 TaxID=1448321 RepID=A0A317WEC3_9EURO|nr:actin-like ATPase domain-containing protein [Aspergillus heteromorphus CBS 117.55]PWY83597.1 actin-like ATPase domain-containing protein [Aspergillus heteromorphus CBS 117.55]
MSDNGRLYLGIDFGNTTVGVAAIYPPVDGEDQSTVRYHVIDRWRVTHTREMGRSRLPTRLAYSEEGFHLRSRLWGYAILPAAPANSWFKLPLDEGIMSRVRDGRFIEDKWTESVGIFRQSEGRSYKEMASTFLSYLDEEIRIFLRRAKLHNLPKTLTFTYPATWSDESVVTLREAIHAAGFGTDEGDQVVMGPEPLAVVSALMKPDSGEIKIKATDAVIVCDCGGSTIDITSYDIVTSDLRPPTQLTAHTEPLLGSTCIDRAFYELVSTRLIPNFDKLGLRETSPTSMMMRDFEEVKRKFDENSAAYRHAFREVIKFRQEYACRVYLLQSQLRDLFQPVVTRICNLLSEQIDEANRVAGKDIINKIILIGGFAGSPYLESAIRQRFETNEMTVYRPDRPENIIAASAALWAKEYDEATPHPTYHYGVEFGQGPDNTVTDDIAWFRKKHERFDQPNTRKAIRVKCTLNTKVHGTAVYFFRTRICPAPEKAKEGVELIGAMTLDLTTLINAGTPAEGDDVVFRFLVNVGLQEIDVAAFIDDYHVGRQRIPMA